MLLVLCLVGFTACSDSDLWRPIICRREAQNHGKELRLAGVPRRICVDLQPVG